MTFKTRLFERVRQGFRILGNTPDVESVDSVLSLAEYKALVASLPTPTVLQTQQFAQFIARAHSWYKHLPLLPPGGTLHVFLDPAAGMQLVRDSGGHIEATHRLERGRHYSWRPTAEYRERFGFLAFSRSSGSSVAFKSPDGAQLIGSDNAACAYDHSLGRLCPIPKEVLDAGRARVSGIIHTLGANPHLWIMVIDDNLPMNLPVDTIESIRHRCHELMEDPSKFERLETSDPRVRADVNLHMVDFALYDILSIERKRQTEGLIAAVQRMVQLVSTSDV